MKKPYLLRVLSQKCTKPHKNTKWCEIFEVWGWFSMPGYSSVKYFENEENVASKHQKLRKEIRKNQAQMTKI